MQGNGDSFLGVMVAILILVLVIGGVVAALMFGLPKWGAWRAEISGEAKLREAESSRQIRVEVAKAELEAAGLDAQAEIERAKGVAEANQIIGDSLKDNEAYLKWRFIEGLHNGFGEVIYVPTEAGLPILEAGRQRTVPSDVP